MYPNPTTSNAVWSIIIRRMHSGMYGKLIEVMVIIALETYFWNIQMLFGVIQGPNKRIPTMLFRTHKNFVHYSNFKFFSRLLLLLLLLHLPGQVISFSVFVGVIVACTHLYIYMYILYDVHRLDWMLCTDGYLVNVFS